MANKKISELEVAILLDGTELIPVVQSGSNKSATPSLLKTFTQKNTVNVWGYVTAYANLPLGITDTDPEIDDIVGVNTTTGIWLIGTQRRMGFYKRVALTGNVATDYGTTPFAGMPLQADQATVDAGTDDTLYVTPLTLASTNIYEVPLTFGSGITRTVNAIANDLITGKTGGQTAYGGLAQTEALTLMGNIATASGTNIAGGDVYIKATPGTGTGASSLHFFTGTTLTTGSTLQTSSEKVIILGNGNVGIGTTNPNALLDIYGSVNPKARVTVITSASTNNASGVDFYTSSGEAANLVVTAANYATQGEYTANSLFFQSWLGKIMFATRANYPIEFLINGFQSSNVAMYIAATTGNVGIGTTAPTAYLHLKAGTASVSTAPLKFTTGVALTTAELGAVGFTDPDFYISITDTTVKRKFFILNDGTNLTSGKIPIASTNGRLIDGQTPLAGSGSFYVSATSGGSPTVKIDYVDGIITGRTD